MKKLKILSFLCLIVFSSCKTKPSNIIETKKDTISVASFGLVPDMTGDAVPYVRRALEACAKVKNPILVFPKGCYNFYTKQAESRNYFESNTTDNNPKKLAVLIRQMANLTLDGEGSEFIFHGRIQPFSIDSSRNITMRNFSIDWETPLTAQSRVGKITANYIDIEIDKASPYLIRNGKIIFITEVGEKPWWGVMEFGAKDHLIPSQSGDNCLGNGWQNYRAEELSKGIVRLHYPFARKPKQGNWLVMRHSERDHAGIFVVDSKQIKLENINVYHTAGLGILSQYSENLTYTHINCVPNEQKGRIFSGHDDGLHFSNCKGQITVDSCRFRGLMDDPINVHGTGVRIIKKWNDTKIRCRFMHAQSVGMRWACVGDTVGFINHQSMYTVGDAQVKCFSKIDDETFDVEFEDSIPSSIVEGDALENLTWTPDVSITNSYFGSCRARGILMTTPGKVLIENNQFESSGSAILIAGDANGWYETGAVKNVLIQHNLFKASCLGSSYQFCEGVISVCPEIPQPDVLHPYHRNIVIRENEFHLFDYPILYAFSVNGIKFLNNTLIRSTENKPWHPRKIGLTFDACQKIKVSNNTIEGDVLGTTIQLINTSQQQLENDAGSGFVLIK